MQQPFWMLTPMDAHSIPELWPAGRREADAELPAALTQQLGSQPEIKALDGKEWFCDQLLKSGRVCLFGGGHVAAALAPVLIPLEFPCVVLENRSEFADPARFPEKCQVQLIDFERCTEQFSFRTDDYVCIMTRGHLDDLTVLTQILKTDVKYIGLIGSARKIKTTFEKLKDLGFCDEDLKRIIPPIRIPIGGKSPAEIAISIAAQLIQCRCEAPSKYWPRRDNT